jgi:hypothetical protein
MVPQDGPNPGWGNEPVAKDQTGRGDEDHRSNQRGQACFEQGHLADARHYPDAQTGDQDQGNGHEQTTEAPNPAGGASDLAKPRWPQLAAALGREGPEA